MAQIQDGVHDVTEGSIIVTKSRDRDRRTQDSNPWGIIFTKYVQKTRANLSRKSAFQSYGPSRVYCLMSSARDSDKLYAYPPMYSWFGQLCRIVERKPEAGGRGRNLVSVWVCGARRDTPGLSQVAGRNRLNWAADKWTSKKLDFQQVHRLSWRLP